MFGTGKISRVLLTLLDMLILDRRDRIRCHYYFDGLDHIHCHFRPSQVRWTVL